MADRGTLEQDSPGVVWIPEGKTFGFDDYLGAFECQAIGRLLRDLEPQGIVRHSSQERVLRIRTGAYQAEFLRETLMGARNTAYVRQPGTDWPETDHENHARLTARLERGFDIFRRWDYDVPSTRAYKTPQLR